MPQKSATKRPRLPGGLILVLPIAAVLCYVAANLLVINMVEILHHFTFTVEVVDRQTSRPIAGAAVSWKRTNPGSGFQWLVPIGKTDSDGRLSFKETLQEQPAWVWPMLGHFRFASLLLDVQAKSYQAQDIHVAEALRDIPYRTTSGAIHIGVEP